MSQVLDTFGCLNNTIKVAAGHYVDLANPDPKSIDILSIAAALSKICRFGGHCPRFYSVAEHSVHATIMAVRESVVDRNALLAIFLHDAAEAYVGDMVKPLKVTMPQYGDAEQRIESAIEVAFAVDFHQHKDTIKRFDRAMLKAEKTAMWPEDKETWAGFGDIEDRAVRFEYWLPPDAEANFIWVARTLQLVG